MMTRALHPEPATQNVAQTGLLTSSQAAEPKVCQSKLSKVLGPSGKSPGRGNLSTLFQAGAATADGERRGDCGGAAAFSESNFQKTVSSRRVTAHPALDSCQVEHQPCVRSAPPERTVRPLSVANLCPDCVVCVPRVFGDHGDEHPPVVRLGQDPARGGGCGGMSRFSVHSKSVSERHAGVRLYPRYSSNTHVNCQNIRRATTAVYPS